MIAATQAAAGWESAVEHPARFVRAMLALAAFGVACDNWIVTRLGGHGAASLAGSLALAAPVVVAAAWHFVACRRVRPAPSALLALLAFVGWSAASTIWSLDVDVSVTRTITNLQLLVLVWLLWQLTRSRAELRALLGGYVIGCVVLAVLAWRNSVAGVYFSWGRFSADGFDPNDLSVYLALGVPMACYLALARGRPRDRLALLYVPLAWVALGLSGSRAGLLSLATGLAAVLVWVSVRSASTLALLSAVLVVGFAIAWSMTPAENLTRFLTVQQEVSGTVGARADIWRAGFAVLESHPILGVGAGGFGRSVAPVIPRIVAHSTPLSIAVELGVIGLLLFAVTLVLVLWGVRRSGLDERALAWILLLVLCVGTASLTWETRKPLWLVLLLGAALGALRPRLERPGPA